MGRDKILMGIETRHKVKTVQSEIDKNLNYVFDDEHKGIGLLVLGKDCYQFIALTRNQARAVRDELADMCEMIFD